ncbi:MAG: class I SAM-dependent methyltransferase [Cocleimonas sp.]|nr:class I SAM-dependent methyltransferase [Cocleimonas sp.]
MLTSLSLAISGSLDANTVCLERIATDIQYPFIPQHKLSTTSNFQYLLYLNHHHLALYHYNKKKPELITIDFLEGKMRHRRLYGGGKGQDLAKAIGIKKNPNVTVLDLTAGLGRDAFVLASLNCNVTLLERNPIIYHLLNNGLSRALASDDETVRAICKRMRLFNQNAIDYLTPDIEKPDVIYLDPMFPRRKKSAKVKKEMLFFHDIVGNDPDSHHVLSHVLPYANKRIVVKRPRLSDPLGDFPPDFCITGKSTRYDIYLPKP